MADWVYGSHRTDLDDGWIYGSNLVTGYITYAVSVTEAMTLSDINAISITPASSIITVSATEALTVSDSNELISLEHEANIKNVILIN